MPKTRGNRSAPVGQCIYCGTKEGVLNEEHILPAGLHGTWILTKACCNSCQKHINEDIENPVLHKSLRELRYIQRIGLRKINERPTELDLRIPPKETQTNHHNKIIDPNKFAKRTVSLDDYPKYIVLPIYAVPIIEATKKHKPTDHVIKVRTGLGGPRSRKNIIPFFVQTYCDPVRLALMLAKIAHGFSILTLGLEGFVPYLNDILTGKDTSRLYDFVGGTGIENCVPKKLHDIKIGVKTIDLEPLVVVDIQLFCDLQMPVYRVYIGKYLKRGYGFVADDVIVSI